MGETTLPVITIVMVIVIGERSWFKHVAVLATHNSFIVVQLSLE